MSGGSAATVVASDIADAVQTAFVRWAEATARARPELYAAGHFGSTLRGPGGVGTDLAVILIVDDTDVPFQDRPDRWGLTGLPVPAEVLVYNRAEWQTLLDRATGSAGCWRRTRTGWWSEADAGGAR